MAGTKDIFDGARLYLGDLSATRYTENVLRIALNVALMAIANDIGTEFTYNAGSNSIDPTPSKLQQYLISLGIAMVLLVGEETTSALDGGGLLFKSGISSISLNGYHDAIQKSGGKIKLLYDDCVLMIRINSLTAGEYDSYIKNNTALLNIN